MKKISVLLAGAMLMMAVGGGVANATTITYTKNVLADGQYMPTGVNVANMLVETFDAQTQLLAVTDNFAIVTGSVASHNAAPAGALSVKDPSRYLTVPDDLTTGTFANATFGPQLYDYFGLWWGSADAYNTLEFLKDNVVVATYLGNTVLSPGNGNQNIVATNNYVNFYDLPEFNSFRLTSTSYAFEADNFAVGTVVPEPGTMVLLGAGLLGLAIFGKRRMHKV